MTGLYIFLRLNKTVMNFCESPPIVENEEPQYIKYKNDIESCCYLLVQVLVPIFVQGPIALFYCRAQCLQCEAPAGWVIITGVIFQCKNSQALVIVMRFQMSFGFNAISSWYLSSAKKVLGFSILLQNQCN